MSLALVVIGIALAGLSGVPGLFLARSSPWSQRIAAFATVAGAALGLAGVFAGLHGGELAESTFPWAAVGNSIIGVDPLSAFFLVPIFLVGGLGSIYGLGYWAPARHPRSVRMLRLFWGSLVAGMGILVIARHAMAFLFGWEVMALSAYFLVSAEDHRVEARSAGWIYLVATHVATLTLFATFALWRSATGSYALRPVAADAIDLATMNVLFFSALLAFGLKAGMMPLHFWLPAAHANAPSHVSAMLSGVVLKMGIYGLLRFLSLFPAPPLAWGGVILVLGAASGLFGVVFALGQHDLKRLLAYHSVENIGIILMGFGLALLGRSTGRPELVLLGMAGCLLHVWNHCLFKALLFLGAGSVVYATRTQEIDRLGGLAKAMPWTAATFLIGAVAICGLPPLNGFVSELFVYLGLLRAMVSNEGGSVAAVAVAPLLAAVGALAVACFVKAFGAAFLGSPRTVAASRAQESPTTMTVPMAVLAACCTLIGVCPLLVAPMLERVTVTWMPELAVGRLSHLASLVPFQAVSAMAFVLIVFTAVLVFLTGRGILSTRWSGTWDCGYARPTSRMQYTASSFAQTIVGLYGWVLRPQVHAPAVHGLYPQRAESRSHVDDAVLDRLLLPLARAVELSFGWFHRFQRGLTQHYVLYVLITVILMLSTLIPFDEYVTRVFAR